MAVFMKLKQRRETINNIDDSKLLGDPVMQLGFDYDHCLDDDELFVAQIDCKKASAFDEAALLPKSGWLWFFVDLDEYPYVPRVIYSKEDPDIVLEDYNELWIDDTSKSYGITFSAKPDDDCGVALAETVCGSNVVLMRLDAAMADIPVLRGAGTIRFIIDRNDLLNRTFDNVRILIG